jgi:hypothetical protein
MILGDSHAAASAPHDTLDGLFRRAGVRHADIIALADPPDRHAIDGIEARWFTFAEADRAVSAIAATLRQFDLPADTVVAYQLPNTVENVLTFLGILRAGMIAAPLPLLWRKADIVAALTQVGARALVTAGRAGAYAAAATAMQAAADLFPVRFVCGWGDGLSDGIVALDPLLSAGDVATVPALPREGDAARHIAAITWEITARGPVPVARSHAELLAAMPPLAVSDAAPLSLLSATPPTSFAGIALTLLPWLAHGGTLHLHHGFDPETFIVQAGERHCGTIVVPGPLLEPLADAGFFSLPDVRQVAALWRAPEMLNNAPAWHEAPALIDAAAFGELGLVYAARPRGEAPAPLRSGAALRLSRNDDGVLALSGAMLPSGDLAPATPADDMPRLDRRFGGVVATGYRCRFEPRDESVTVTAPPPDLVGIGGYRLARSEIETTASLFGDTTIAVLPNALTGHRLAGAAEDGETVAALLAEQGTHALIAGAFGA